MTISVFKTDIEVRRGWKKCVEIIDRFPELKAV